MRRFLTDLFVGTLAIAAVSAAAPAPVAAAPLSVEDTRAPIEGLGVLSGEAVLIHRDGRGLEIAPLSPLDGHVSGANADFVEILSVIRTRDARRAAEAADADIYSTRALDELTRLLAAENGPRPFHLSAIRTPGVFFEGAQRPPVPADRWFRILSGDAWGGPPILIVLAMLAAFGAIFWMSRFLFPARR